MSTVIALDGPAGSGKSTVARLLAERLGIPNVNTGSLYRALALHARRIGVAVEQATPEFLAGSKISFAGGRVLLDGEDPGDELRAPDMAAGASRISAIPLVREFLLPVQRSAASSGWIVMEGRDIGTVVFPDARSKFYLTASLEARARRRLAQSGENASGATFESVCADLMSRDERDSSRATAPLRKADDAVLVDTSDMTVDEVVEYIIGRLPAEIRPVS